MAKIEIVLIKRCMFIPNVFYKNLANYRIFSD